MLGGTLHGVPPMPQIPLTPPDTNEREPGYGGWGLSRPTEVGWLMGITARQTWRSYRFLPLLFATAFFLASCDGDGVEPGAGSLPIALALRLPASAGGPAEAFARVDQVSIRVTVGGTVVHESTEAFDPAGETRVRVRLDRSLAGSSVRVDVTLRVSGSAVFRGQGTATLQEVGATTVELDLLPVVGGIALQNPVALFTALGDRQRLSAAAVFATGDTIPGVTITWRGLDPSIVTVSANGDAQSVSDGDARVEAQAEGVTANGTARVRAEAATVTVTPSPGVVSVGQTLPFEARIADRNGNRLSRAPTWASSNTAAATISASGVATGVAQGVTTISARADNATGSAQLTVVAIPLAPSNLSGRILNEAARTFELSWQDRSTNETGFTVERRVGTGAWMQFAQVGANTTTFQGVATPGENHFRVVACNSQGCSPPSNEVMLNFRIGPPVVRTLASPDVGTLRGDVSASTQYRTQFHFGFSPADFEPNCGQYEICYYETPFQVSRESREWTAPLPFAYSGETVWYRIMAENEYGQALGDLRSLQIPDLAFSANPTTYVAGQTPVTLSLTYAAPAGTAQSPIASVQFFGVGSAGADGIPDIIDSGGQRLFIYRVNYIPPAGYSSVFVYATAFFRSGVGVDSDGFCIGSCSGELRDPRLKRSGASRIERTSGREEQP